MQTLAVFFDLDGTLTDSAEGVINCFQLTLRHFGLPWEDRAAMRVCVGPPLRTSFPWFGVREDQLEEALEVYRARYNTVGKFENAPFPGIRDLLDTLKREGFPLYVATSKPERTALEVLDKYGLTPYFDLVCGATFDGTRDAKDDVLRYLTAQLPPDRRAVMVGDTIYDVEGANRLGLPAIGVTWGYGDAEEMARAGAAIAEDYPALLRLIRSYAGS